MARVFLCAAASVCFFEVVRAIGVPRGAIRLAIADPRLDDVFFWRLFKDLVYLFWGAVFGWLWQMKVNSEDLAKEIEAEMAHRKALALRKENSDKSPHEP
jgi:hypothetical protein